MRYLRVLKNGIKIGLMEGMAYRLDFAIKLFAFAVFSIVAPIVSIVIYGITPGLPGWSLYELLVLQGASSFTLGLGSFLFGSFVGNTLYEIREGYFDRALTRPANPLLLQTASWPAVDNLAGIITGISILSYGLSKTAVQITLPNLLMFAVLVALGILFLYSLSVITVAIGFVAIKSESLYRFVERIFEFADYPISIFGPIGAALFTFVFPIGLASFYPAQALLGLVGLKMLATLTFISLAFFGVSLLAWKAGMKKYQSAGG